MQLTVTFLKHYLEIDWDSEALKGWFEFSLVDSALVGTPKEKSTIHMVRFRMSYKVMANWGLDSGRGSKVSEEMTKVAFQSVEDYVSDEIKKNPLPKKDLPPFDLTTKNSPESCPYNLANIGYPGKKAFTVAIETQVSPLQAAGSANDEEVSLPLRLFISYSTTDKHIAGRVKGVLAKLGLSSFLAHDDIRVSEEWKSRIMEELNGMNVFVALLSKSFKKSDWASQEVGMALFRTEVLVIPLSVDGTAPFGLCPISRASKLRPTALMKTRFLNQSSPAFRTESSQSLSSVLPTHRAPVAPRL